MTTRHSFPFGHRPGPFGAGAAGGGTIAPIATQEPVLGVAYSFTPSVAPPGVYVWTSVGAALPSWLTLNSATGNLSATVAIADLLDVNFGQYPGIQLRATGPATIDSNVFDVNAQGVSTMLPGDLTAAWNMTTASSPQPDGTGNGFNAGLVNAPVLQVAGVVGLAMQLGAGTGGQPRHITVNTNPALNFGANRTWVTTFIPVNAAMNSSGGSKPFMSKNTSPTGGASLITGGGLDPGIYLASGEFAAEAGGSYAVGVSHQIIGTLDGSNALRFYRDGILRGTDPSVTVPAPVAGPLNVGRSPFSGSGVDEILDESEVWNRALTSNEAATRWWLSGRGVTLQSWVGF